MRVIKNLIFFFLVCTPFLVASQNTLTIIVEGVASSDGYIAVGAYTGQGNFLEDKKAYAGVFAEAQKGNTRVRIPNLPNGTYAISLFHDENGNKELDTNFIGIPKEPVGFSIGKLKTFGPPSFEECSFEMRSDFEIKIPIE